MRKFLYTLTFIMLGTVLAAGMSGCRGGKKTNERINSFIGEPIDSAITHYGVPVGKAKMSDGKILYEWRWRRDYFDAVWGVMHGTCSVRIIADDSGTIVNANFAGKACE